MFIQTILEKKKKIKIFSRKFNSIVKDSKRSKNTNKYTNTNKLTNTQLNKLKSAAKNKARAILRINKKNFEVEELPHQLFLTARQLK